jgi:excisionase family DNA binding protein
LAEFDDVSPTEISKRKFETAHASDHVSKLLALSGRWGHQDQRLYDRRLVFRVCASMAPSSHKANLSKGANMTESVRVPAETERRALSVEQFCKRYGIGKSTLYVQIREGRLRVRKVGKRSVIAVDDAEIWFRNLRTVDPELRALPPI